MTVCEAVEWRSWLTAPAETIEPYVQDHNQNGAAGIAKGQQEFRALLADDGTIEVWRAMRMHSPVDLGLAPIGRYFTYRKEFAIAYDAGRSGYLYRVHARLPGASINWPETLAKFGSGEFEITAHDGKPIIFLDIDWISDRGMVLDPDLRLGLAGHSMLTGPAV